MSVLSQIDPESTLIFVCDVQERFRTAIFGFDAMVKSCTKVIKAAKLLQIPVIATEQNPRALGATVQELRIADLPSALNLGAHPKTKFSMVVPPLTEALQERKTKSVVLVGIESHVCVLQTTLDLLRQGIAVYVLADAVSSCNKQEIPIALDLIRQAGAVVTTTESILFQLVGDASNANFKPFSAMIKEEKGNTQEALQTLLESPLKSSL